MSKRRQIEENKKEIKEKNAGKQTKTKELKGKNRKWGKRRKSKK